MSQLSSEVRRSRPTSNVARQIPIVILYRQGEARCQRSVSERNRSQQSILRQAQANPFLPCTTRQLTQGLLQALIERRMSRHVPESS